jgi:hypothetical protein
VLSFEGPLAIRMRHPVDWHERHDSAVVLVVLLIVGPDFPWIHFGPIVDLEVFADGLPPPSLYSRLEAIRRAVVMPWGSKVLMFNVEGHIFRASLRVVHAVVFCKFIEAHPADS